MTSFMTGSFDLNIEMVLENWEIHHGIREIIANALDEMKITNTKPIEITKDNEGLWHIRDFGRGLQYKNLTQNESDEKAHAEGVIGKFGVGLKDALAVFYRHDIPILIYTPFGDISLEMVAKSGFSDVKTLNAVISAPTKLDITGTEFVMNVRDEDIQFAREMFLYFRDADPLDTLEHGEIYRKASGRTTAFIYVHGVKVSEEENYLFDYNITKTTTGLNKALNRERSNVGRSAYSEIVKKMLLKSVNESVIQLLIDELNKFSSGLQSDEARLTDIMVHAVKMYNQQKKIVVISSSDSYAVSENDKEIINDSGRVILIVPDLVYDKVEKLEDYRGNPIGTLDVAKAEYNDSFVYDFVSVGELTKEEFKVWNLREKAFKYYGDSAYRNKIKISNNINSITSGDTLGVYDLESDMIIIKRSQLKNIGSFMEVLFHELAHATSKTDDNTRAFENELGKIISELSLEIFEEDQNQQSEFMLKTWIRNIFKN